MSFDSNPVVEVSRYILGATAVTGNIMVLILIKKYLKVKNHTYNQLVVLSNLCDILIGSGSLIRSIYKTYATVYNVNLFKFSCYLVSILPSCGNICDHSVLFALAFDRLLAISKPIKYTVGKFRHLPLVTIFVCFLMAILFVFGGSIGVEMSERATVCTLGGIRGRTGDLIFTFIGFTFFVSSTTTYLTTFVLFMKSRKSSAATRELKYQYNLFFSISYIFVINFFVYGVPIVFYIFKFTINLPQPMVDIISLAVAYGKLITANLNACIYLFQHREINRSFKKLFGGHKTENSTVIMINNVNTTASKIQ